MTVLYIRRQAGPQMAVSRGEWPSRDSRRESPWAAATQWRAKTGRQATGRPSGGGDPTASGARPKVSASTTSTSAKLAGERSGLLKKDACLPDACAPDWY